MDMKRVLITGASGLLGRAVLREFTGRGDWEALGLAFSRVSDNLRKIDLTDEKQVENVITEFKPSIVIHTAAIRRPDEVENKQELTHAVNIDGTEFICKYAAKVAAPVVFISTDYVFDGTSPPYTVDAQTNPLNKYGVSKLDGEKVTMKASKANLILRLPVLYGPVQQLDESAVNCLFAVVKDGSKEKKMSDYEIKCPTHVEDVAMVLRELCDKNLEDGSVCGVFHWSGDEKLTKYQQACIMAEVFDLPTSHMIPDKAPSAGVLRPHDSYLDTSRLQQLGINHQRKFKHSIRAELEPYFNS